MMMPPKLLQILKQKELEISTSDTNLICILVSSTDNKICFSLEELAIMRWECLTGSLGV